MIAGINSEDRLVQKTFADHLHDSLQWESFYAYNDETFGPAEVTGSRSHGVKPLVELGQANFNT